MPDSAKRGVDSRVIPSVQAPRRARPSAERGPALATHEDAYSVVNKDNHYDVGKEGADAAARSPARDSERAWRGDGPGADGLPAPRAPAHPRHRNMLVRSQALPLLVLVAACRPSPPPPTAPASPSSGATTEPGAASAEPPLPLPAMPVGPPLVPAPPPAPANPSPPFEPDLDCATFAGGRAPSPRFLCELAMGKRTASSLVDARGYAYVAYYTNAGDGPSEWKIRERACGARAVAALGGLLGEIRQKLSYADSDPWVSCKGTVCDVRAEGEWSTPQRLYFRQGAGGPVLEAWTRIEVALVPPEMAAARSAWIDQGRWALAGKGCAR